MVDKIFIILPCILGAVLGGFFIIMNQTEAMWDERFNEIDERRTLQDQTQLENLEKQTDCGHLLFWIIKYNDSWWTDENENTALTIYQQRCLTEQNSNSVSIE